MEMENGKWKWKMENGKWRMETGKWKMEMEHGKLKWNMEMGNGKWTMESLNCQQAWGCGAHFWLDYAFCEGAGNLMMRKLMILGCFFQMKLSYSQIVRLQ